MEYPLVTVIIPTYNRENTISRAIDSVLQQTYKNIEVIVVDDCSTDATVERIKSCKDNRIRMICLPFNRGANRARNEGIKNAKGDFIAFQDSDDEWLEDKLDKQIGYMIDKNLDALFCPYVLCDGDQRKIIPYDFQKIDLYTVQLKEKLKRGNVVGTPTLVVKKDIFSQIGMFDEEMARLQDYEFVIRIIKRFRLGYLDKPLVKAYRTNNSISTNEKALLDAYKILVRKHLDFIDLEGVVSYIFNFTSVFREEKINWKELDDFADIIKAGQNCEEEKKWNKLVVDHIYNKFFIVRKMLEEWYRFFCNDIRDRGFAIYGAGTFGQKAYYDIKSKNRIPKYFLVTEYGENRELEGIPIVELTSEIDKSIPIVVAVSWEKQSELIRNLQSFEIYRFCVYPFCY